jgi:LysM repeat protein
MNSSQNRHTEGTAMISAPPVYVVVPHDTLSQIAASHGIPLFDLEKWNPQVSDPDVIYVGQELQLAASGPSPSSIASIPPATHAESQGTTTGSSGFVHVPGMPDSYAACIEMRESSDNPRAVNSIPGFQGRGGGQFGIMDYTWHSLGYSGQPYDAPLSEQVQAASTLYQQYGHSPWSPSDHC